MTPIDTLTEYARDGAPHLLEGETPRAYWTRCGLLDHGFSYDELVRRSWLGGFQRKFSYPDTDNKIYRLTMTLALANVFRERAISESGVAGLRPAAAYRPSGGESNSQHKSASALDLDPILPKGLKKAEKYERMREYGRCAVRFWCEWGPELSVGLGLYVWGKMSTPVARVHLDTDYKCRSWQGVSYGWSKFARPYPILCNDGRTRMLGLPVKLAHDMALDVPSLDYL